MHVLLVTSRRMQAMAEALAVACREHGNWDFIRNKRAAWERYTGHRPRARRLSLFDVHGDHLAGNLQRPPQRPVRLPKCVSWSSKRPTMPPRWHQTRRYSSTKPEVGSCMKRNIVRCSSAILRFLRAKSGSKVASKQLSNTKGNFQ
ncbi:hypothetical protein [Massilia sp. S19_KUP03_FR1]|uniref:hypothetical protein n=1 Tax=Massilia sp. S19_KUP03_FR1 TaxID=3025503 RepID=UPI002FCDE0F6